MTGLDGRVALVTGVSRRAGIGYAIAHRLLAEGAAVFCQSWTPHDAEQPWGADPLGPAGVTATLAGARGSVGHAEIDLAEAASSAALVNAAVDRFGPLDILVANHARSSQQSLATLTATELDRSWAVNARASVLLVQAFAAQHDGRPGGRVVLFTSGQHLGPMADELPYAISKGAIHQMTRSLAAAVAERGITVNTVNPGPTDTGWAAPDVAEQVRRRFPSGRWNTPDDAAAVVAWLVSDDAAAVTGTVVDAMGGYRA